MSTLVRIIVISCIASTSSIIFYLLFSALSIFVPLEERQVVLLIGISFTITIFVTLKRQFYHSSSIMSTLIEIVFVVFVLSSAGWIFKMFPLNLYYFLTVGLSGVLSYALVIVIIYISGMHSASEINKIISKKKG